MKSNVLPETVSLLQYMVLQKIIMIGTIIQYKRDTTF